MGKRWIAVLGVSCVSWLVPVGPAPGAEPQTGDEIVACAAANMPKGDDLRSITMITRDRAGAERILRANVFGRRTASGKLRLVVRFTQPEDLEGSSLLISEQDAGTQVVMHTLFGDKELSGGDQASANLFGTGMSYEDFLYLLGVVRTVASNLQRLDDESIDERPVYVLQTLPDSGSSAYERVVMSVDKKTCVPLEVRAYENHSRGPRKVFTADPSQIFPVGSAYVAHAVELRDERDGKHTDLRIETVNPLPPLPDEFFLPAGLSRYRPKVQVKIELEEINPEPGLIAPETLR